MKQIKRYWRIILPILTAILIWNISASSHQANGAIARFFAQAFNSSAELSCILASFSLFALLGYTISSFTKGLNPGSYPDMSKLCYASILPIIFACLNEVRFIADPNHYINFSAIIINSLAACAGALLYIAIFCFYRRLRFYLALKKSTRAN